MLELAANGQRAGFIKELVPSAPDSFTGVVVVTANRRIGATVILVAPEGFTTFPVVQNRVRSRSFYAQFAHVLDFVSQLLLVNPSPLASATVVVRLRRSDGSPPPAGLTLGGQPLTGGQRTITIPPLGCAVLQTGGSADFVGSVEVSADKPEGNGVPVGGVVLFSSPTIGTAGVGEGFGLASMVLGISRINAGTAGGTDTGIAVVNTKDQDVTLRLTVRDQNGNVVGSVKEIVLKARNQLARFPNEDPLNLALPANFTGSLWIEVKEKDCQVAITVIRQSPGVLTTFPVISLEQVVTPAS